MGNSFRWIALFRDGTTIEQPLVSGAMERRIALTELWEYLNGTIDNPKKHFLIWFKLINDNNEFTVQFDSDGDAYIDTPGGGCIMTEFKIRSSRLIYCRESNGNEVTYLLGFGGMNTCGDDDGKAIIINDDGSWKLVSEMPTRHASMVV